MNSNKLTELRDEILRMSGTDPIKCMRCGKCTASCPSFDSMEYHPHEFVYMIETGNIGPLLKSESLYKCLSCFACVDRCPREVEPAKLAEALRLAVIRRQGCDRLLPDDIPGLIDSDTPQQLIVSALRKYRK